MMDASTNRTFLLPFTAEVSAVKGSKEDNMECKISRRKGTALEKCFLHAVSEILEIPRAQAEEANKRKEMLEQA